MIVAPFADFKATATKFPLHFASAAPLGGCAGSLE